MDFRLDQAQFVVFFSAVDTSGKLKIASSAVQAVGELSGVDPLMLPIPDNAPPEIPRIQLQNEAAGWVFQYSPLRIDLFNTPRVELRPDRIPEELAELKGRSADLWDALTASVSAKGKRLALVINVSAAVERSADLVQAKFLSPQIAGALAEAQVHFLRKMDVAGLPSNRWVRILSQEASPERLLIHIDFNTVAERVLEVSSQMIREYTDSASRGVAEVLNDVIGG